MTSLRKAYDSIEFLPVWRLQMHGFSLCEAWDQDICSEDEKLAEDRSESASPSSPQATSLPSSSSSASSLSSPLPSFPSASFPDLYDPYTDANLKMPEQNALAMTTSTIQSQNPPSPSRLNGVKTWPVACTRLQSSNAINYGSNNGRSSNDGGTVRCASWTNTPPPVIVPRERPQTKLGTSSTRAWTWSDAVYATKNSLLWQLWKYGAYRAVPTSEEDATTAE